MDSVSNYGARKSLEGRVALNRSTLDVEKSRNSQVPRPATTDKKWGVDGYYVPNNDWMHERVHTFWSNTKKEAMISIEARKRKELPPPTLYQKLVDWSKNSQGKFFKSKRVTLID